MIEKFVDAKDVDPIYFESPYYVAPDGAVAEETFRVIQSAMREKQKVALSRVVLSNRERLIALMCRDKGLLMMTLRTADEVRDAEDYFTDIEEEEPDKEMLELAERLIEQKSGKFDPNEFRDRYQDALLEMVKAKARAGAGDRPGAGARQGDQSHGRPQALARGREAGRREQAAQDRRQGSARRRAERSAKPNPPEEAGGWSTSPTRSSASSAASPRCPMRGSRRRWRGAAASCGAGCRNAPRSWPSVGAAWRSWPTAACRRSSPAPSRSAPSA